MKRVAPFLVSCFLLLCATSICEAQQVRSYTVIDVPGAAVTYPLSINNNGDVAGGYCLPGVPDCSPARPGNRGFVRQFNGNLTTFDGVPVSINDGGTVTGFLYDATGLRSFIRDRMGNTTIFDIPSDPPGLGSGMAINNEGEIAGYILHCILCDFYFGFVRDRQGALTTWEAGGVPISINARGDVTGNTDNYGGASMGFVRTRNGNLTTFDVPGVKCAGPGLFPNSINNKGVVAGWSSEFFPDVSQCKYRGFIRTADGTLTAFDATPDVLSTLVYDINSRGDVTGIAEGGRLFLRTANGNITFFDVPMPQAPILRPSLSGKGLILNDRGDIAGNSLEYDAAKGYIVHAFLLSVR